jgi:small-conductance mechanosensitive channel
MVGSSPAARHRTPRRRRRRHAGTALLWAMLAVGAPVVSAQTADRPHDLEGIEDTIATAPVEVDGQALFRVRGATSMPADIRAARISRRIEAAAANRSISLTSVRVVEADGFSWIQAGEQPLFAVTDADARLEQLPRAELAVSHLARVRLAMEDYRRLRQPDALREHIRDTIVAGLVATLLVALVLVLNRFGRRSLARSLRRRAPTGQFESVTFLRAERIYGFARQVLNALTGLLLAAILFQLASFGLARFPGTRYLANHLASVVVDPLRVIGRGAISQIPNVVFLIILTVVFRIALRLFRIVFEAIERGGLRISGFDPDWAVPTYKIVRFGWIAFGVVVAYPYLPGSQSDAFKGISIFVGVLLSLGSSSAIANIIAGYLLIYRRAFKVGDRVQIGQMVGDVTDSRLQVTRLRSVKNEEIVIPNSTILATDVINYSALARSQGLILHTTVGIGYETPWRQVEAMLLIAAERTPGILRTPAPFVLQRALADYAVNYEINVYIDRPNLMLELYHELHRQVLDVFNEYGVQIMTPSYMGDPAKPKVVAPTDWHLAPAKAPRAEGV